MKLRTINTTKQQPGYDLEYKILPKLLTSFLTDKITSFLSLLSHDIHRANSEDHY